jgi:hypothetical protein
VSYASELERFTIDSQYLMVVVPRRLVTDWTVDTGDVYTAPFDYGQVVKVSADDATLTEAADAASVTANTWYYDVDTATLYINVEADPSTFDVVAGYELYLGTTDAAWYRSPLDDSTRVVYFEPLIVRSPQVQASLSDIFFGYMPAASTTIVISNVTQFLQRHLYDSSFHKSELTLYHYVERLTTSTMKVVYRGVVSQIEATDEEVTLKVLDRTDILEVEFRDTTVAHNFFSSSITPLIDPAFKNRPMRTLYGMVEGVIGINWEYDPAEVVNKNRNYFVFTGDNAESDYGELTIPIAASPSSTTTRTYLDSVDGLRVGDDIYVNFEDGGIRDATTITLVESGASPPYIEHDAISDPGETPNSIQRRCIAQGWVIRNGTAYRLQFAFEYLSVIHETVDGKIFAYATLLQTNIISRLGFYVGPNDTLFFRCYGSKNDVTLNGSPLGGDSTSTGNMTTVIPIMVDILKNAVGLAEDEIDIPAFQALASTVTDEVSFQLPFRTGEDFPSCREIIARLCQTAMLRFYLNADNKWTVSQIGPTPAADLTADDQDTVDAAISFAYDYQDVVSDVLVDYAFSEISSKNQVAPEGATKTVRAVSNVAKRLHNVTRQKTFQSLHAFEEDAQRLADRLAFYLGDRRGTLRLTAKHKFFQTELGGVIDVTRTRLPGFEFDDETERTRSYSVIGTSKGLTEITLDLDDLKGINDNSGDW